MNEWSVTETWKQVSKTYPGLYEGWTDDKRTSVLDKPKTWAREEKIGCRFQNTAQKGFLTKTGEGSDNQTWGTVPTRSQQITHRHQQTNDRKPSKWNPVSDLRLGRPRAGDERSLRAWTMTLVQTTFCEQWVGDKRVAFEDLVPHDSALVSLKAWSPGTRVQSAGKMREGSMAWKFYHRCGSL